MRLIDADAFERAVMFSDDEDLQDAIYRLRDFPTIEPERKRGRWINHVDRGMCECDICGEMIETERAHRAHYCPNCGAYMGEENKKDYRTEDNETEV